MCRDFNIRPVDAQHAGCSYRALLAWIVEFGEVARVGVEGTGSYGAGLTPHLVMAGVASRASALPDYDGDVGVQVDAAHPRADDLGAAHPAGLGHEADERGVPQLEEVPPFAGFQQLAQVLDRHDRDGLLGHGWRPDRGHRLVSMSRSRTAEP